MIRVGLRAVAVLIALLGVIDPAVETARRQGVPVRFQLTATAGTRGASDAAAVEDRLLRDLRDVIDAAGERPAAAVVMIGDEAPRELPPGGMSISTVSLARDLSPNVRLLAVADPPSAALRQAVAIEADFEAVGLNGATSVLTVTDGAAIVARAEHRWSQDRERYRARLTYAPPAAGLQVVTVSALPLDAERTAADNQADVALMVEGRPLRVLVFEARPSWAATFVRRALEADARFQVESLARSSRGVTVRSRQAPASVARDGLDAFDVLIVGAPEDVRPAELEAIARFARVRGGGVVFLPDRRPSGPYASMLPVRAVEETLVETPVRLAGGGIAGMRASELLVARGPHAGISAVAAIDRPGGREPVSIGWTLGLGRMIFWGALDAWRFRAADDGAFARFWQAAVADLAVGAPEPVAVTLTPRVAAVNQAVVVRATVRPTEFEDSRDGLELPSIGAVLVPEGGHAEPVRLWPTAEVGVFEGIVRPASPGMYDVQVTAGSRSGHAHAVVRDAPARATDTDSAALRLIADSTGGVHVTAGDLDPLERHLRGLRAASERVTMYPMRSPWWILPFAGCLGAEWALRRRRGLP